MAESNLLIVSPEGEETICPNLNYPFIFELGSFYLSFKKTEGNEFGLFDVKTGELGPEYVFPTNGNQIEFGFFIPDVGGFVSTQKKVPTTEIDAFGNEVDSFVVEKSIWLVPVEPGEVTLIGNYSIMDFAFSDDRISILAKTVDDSDEEDVDQVIRIYVISITEVAFGTELVFTYKIRTPQNQSDMSFFEIASAVFADVFTFYLMTRKDDPFEPDQFDVKVTKYERLLEWEETSIFSRESRYEDVHVLKKANNVPALVYQEDDDFYKIKYLQSDGPRDRTFSAQGQVQDLWYSHWMIFVDGNNVLYVYPNGFKFDKPREWGPSIGNQRLLIFEEIGS